MASLDTTGVIACMFDAEATITVGAQTYAVPANQPIGIPEGITSITVSGATKALCTTIDTYKTYFSNSGSAVMPVLFADEVRLIA